MPGPDPGPGREREKSQGCGELAQQALGSMYQVRWAIGSDISQWWVDYVSDVGGTSMASFLRGSSLHSCLWGQSSLFAYTVFWKLKDVMES